MADVAHLAGVSRTAVSFVLNNIPNANIPEATRQRILQAAQELHYVPSQRGLNLVIGKAMLVALIVRQSSEQMSADAFQGEFVRGVTSVIEPEGYHLLIHAAEPNSPISTYGELVRTGKVDGLLIASPLIADPDVRLLHSEGTPLVLHGSQLGDIASVDVDNRQGAYTAVRHLIQLGHTRIGHISNAPFSYRSSRDRLDGYCEALREANIVCEDVLMQEGSFTASSGFTPMQRLLALPEPPTAVFVGSDVVGLGAIEAIRQRGLHVPGDISLVGFDDILLSRYLDPPLTTVHVPAYELGQEAGILLLTLIRGEMPPHLKVVLPTEMVVRRSTASVPVPRA
ncbi:MAG: LacI family transcriptional regulator [Anaerolineae bacterium]|nr:LacI family transcriptional regulator [Anaerolineae bacterium]